MNTYQRNIHHKISIDQTYNYSNLKGYKFNKDSSKKEETTKINNHSLPTWSCNPYGEYRFPLYL
jgi:hypothetical protein